MSLSIFFFGRKPSNTKLEDGNPLETSAVIAAHAPGIQITSIPSALTILVKSSPGSHIPGIPASLTIAMDLPSLSSLTSPGIFFEELCLLKLVRLFEMTKLFSIFLVCLVSSQAIKETFLRIFNALCDMSFKLPIGVPTI